MKKPKKSKPLGATTDNPRKLIARAIREYDAATNARRYDQEGARMAAENGWLAISSLADVAAEELGLPIPGGASGRRKTLQALDQRVKRGNFLQAYEVARTVLHGECFHEDKCPIHTDAILDGLKRTIDDGMSALSKRKRR